MPRPNDRRGLAMWLAASVLFTLAGCTGSAPSAPPPGATTQPGRPMTEAEVRLFLVGKLGPLWYCDSDSFPVGRDEQQSAIERYPEVVADGDLFKAIAAAMSIDPVGPHTPAEKVAIYRRWKVARAVTLVPMGGDRYRFDFLAMPAEGAAEGKRSRGIVDGWGVIAVEEESLEGEPMCPICLDRLTTIDTPEGAVAVDRLRLGEIVWTIDGLGRRVEGTVVALGSVPAPPGHEMVRVDLSDGRSVTASPGHPLADGRAIGELRVGDELDGGIVSDLDWIPYRGGETFDLAVSGTTGIYLAAGIPLRSTVE